MNQINQNQSYDSIHRRSSLSRHHRAPIRQVYGKPIPQNGPVVVSRFELSKKAYIDRINNETLPLETVNWLIPETTDECRYKNSLITSLYTISEEDECKPIIGSKWSDGQLITSIQKQKNNLGTYTKLTLRKARKRSTMFDDLSEFVKGYYTTRTSIKILNINTLFDYRLTQRFHHMDNIVYADICGGPGGFSEFFKNFTKQTDIRKPTFGYGITLRAFNDFLPNCIQENEWFKFKAIYGPSETGNIYDSDTQMEYIQTIMNGTNNLGVEFALADGGFDVTGQEDKQEVLSKQLYLCQILIALKSLRKDGDFVLKVFDTFTAFSIGLLYLLYCSFNAITIVKPYTSRPANSERYIFCKEYKGRLECQDIIKHLEHVNFLMNDDQSKRIEFLVDVNHMQSDQRFWTYIDNTIYQLAVEQNKQLLKLIEYCRDDGFDILDNVPQVLRQQIRKIVLKWYDI